MKYLLICFTLLMSLSVFSQKMEFIKPNTSFRMDTTLFVYQGGSDDVSKGFKSFVSKQRKDSAFYLSINANRRKLNTTRNAIDSFYNEKLKYYESLNTDTLQVIKAENFNYKGFQGIVFLTKYNLVKDKYILTADLFHKHEEGFNKIFMTESGKKLTVKKRELNLNTLMSIIDNITVHSDKELGELYHEMEKNYTVYLDQLPLNNLYTWGDINGKQSTNNLDSVPLEVLAYAKTSKWHGFNGHHVFRGTIRIVPELDLEILSVETYGPAGSSGSFWQVVGEEDTVMYVERGIRPGKYTKYCKLNVLTEIGLIVPITFKLSFENKLDYFWEGD